MSVISTLIAAGGMLMLAQTSSSQSIDTQIVNSTPQAWIIEKSPTGKVASFRFYRRQIGVGGIDRPWGWIGVRSIEDSNGRILRAFLTSSSCHAIGDAMIEFGNLAIPDWTFDGPPSSPVVLGVDLEPTPKDGVVYVAGLEVLHLRSSASKIEIEFWKGPETETLAGVVRQLEGCWLAEPSDPMPR